MAEKFKATEETKAAFPAASQQLEAAAFSMADDFMNSGQTPSEATSLVAHTRGFESLRVRQIQKPRKASPRAAVLPGLLSLK